jgi:predicted  nucleic acid-binding Zn-ribbon protein
MALVKTELNDRLAHLQERMADLTKENSVKTSEIKRLDTEMRNTKNALSKERRDGQTQRQVLQEEASRVTETAGRLRCGGVV